MPFDRLPDRFKALPVMIVSGFIGWAIGGSVWVAVVLLLQHPVSEIRMWLQWTAIPVGVSSILIGVWKTVFPHFESRSGPVTTVMRGAILGVLIATACLLLMRLGLGFPQAAPYEVFALVYTSAALTGSAEIAAYHLLIRRWAGSRMYRP